MTLSFFTESSVPLHKSVDVSIPEIKSASFAQTRASFSSSFYIHLCALLPKICLSTDIVLISAGKAILLFKYALILLIIGTECTQSM